tara:strand:- start:152 stop:304 length:153 start_codon:yes stop_codon:yes gene_type:complete
MTISFNKEAIKKMTKAEFLKQHKAFAKLIDLEAYYDKLNPKKKVVKRKAK